jgi:hypothetical protein
MEDTKLIERFRSSKKMNYDHLGKVVIEGVVN